MAGFAYSAISIDGLETVGEIHAPDLDAAREQLRIRGLLAHTLRELPASGEEGMRTAFKKIKPRSMQVFSRQFATMIEAGLNIVAALVILEEQTDDAYLAEVIAELRADVEGGLLLSQAMARHPKVFDELYVSMVQAGEASGLLDNVLDRVADQIEKATKHGYAVVGDPDDCAKAIQQWIDIGVDQLTFSPTTNTLSLETIVNSMELFGKEVLPQFDKDPAHSTTKYREAASK